MHFRFFNPHQTIYIYICNYIYVHNICKKYTICNYICNFFIIHNICNYRCFTNEFSFPFCHSQSCCHIVVDSLNDSPTLTRRSVMSDPLWLHVTVATRPLCPWDFPGKNTGVGCHSLLQGIFLIQGLTLHLLHWQTDSLPLSHLGSPAFMSSSPNWPPVLLLQRPSQTSFFTNESLLLQISHFLIFHSFNLY